VRIIDVLSALSTLGGLPALFRTAKTCIGRVISGLQTSRFELALGPRRLAPLFGTRVRRSPSLARLPRGILLICVACLFALIGCSGLGVREMRPSVDWPLSPELPLTIRTLGTDHRFSQLSSTAVAERLRERHPGETVNVLALSGGGAAGAFGAGAVAGLTRSGSRPDFAVVTGVSAGALVAPYAFLGPTWDTHLIDAFTSGTAEHLLRTRGLGAIFGSSLYSGRPLKQLVDAYASDAMIEAVAREADKGRLLLVATTDVVTGEPVVWDLGAIARSGGTSARTLFRDVLVASASVPGMFPPVIIHIREAGAPHDEAHVDGAATVPFFVPRAFVQTPPRTLEGAHQTTVYVIIDGALTDEARTTRLTAHAIFRRSIDAGLSHMLLTMLELTAATAQLQGATLQYSAVPTAYPHLDSFDFRADTRRLLFRYAFECARTGRLWTTFRRTDDDGGTGGSAAETQADRCPADDAFIKYFASR
jgi:predicted acylesterase/phospholipase RssA